MDTRVSAASVAGLVAEIWSSILGLELVVVVDGATTGAMANGGRSLTGVVHISGDIHGTVSLECPRMLAARAASVMFGVDERALGDVEIEDAMGELTNVTAGGVKALVPGTTQLSLPLVVEGRDHDFSGPGTGPVRSVRFTCDGQPVVVRILQSDGSRPISSS